MLPYDTRPDELGSSPLARGLPLAAGSNLTDDGIIPARAGFTRARHPGCQRETDHPRSRGVYSRAPRTSRACSGSSPLARGLRDLLHQDPAGPRIIPARAGFTSSRTRPDHGAPDHPRSRGVYMAPMTMVPQSAGSSPLARGLPTAAHGEERMERIIPARAGFTSSSKTASLLDRDHPRSRGVYASALAVAGTVGGSSPLARGLPSVIAAHARFPGIIPARAGFTPSTHWVEGTLRDHPRSRGVYWEALSPAQGFEGSSPLARGLPGLDAGPCDVCGIIPARAGFTPATPSPNPGRPDHPRSRGVYNRRVREAIRQGGSSPLARGLRYWSVGVVRGGRIIPARAGFTVPSWSALTPTRDHPRSRGVYGMTDVAREAATGSSPLARGLRFRSPRRGGATRIIPARAGFTRRAPSGRRSAWDHPRSRGVYPHSWWPAR